MKALVTKLYVSLAAISDRMQSPFLLLVRLYWGWQLAQTGWGKLMDVNRVAGYFGHLGIPAPWLNAVFITALELVGGLLLALGAGSRLIALLIAGDMAVAFLLADREALTAVFSDPSKIYAAAPYTFLFAAILILCFGPGTLSIDARFSPNFTKPSPPASSATQAREW